MFFLTDLGKNQVDEMENIEDIKGLSVFLDKGKEKCFQSLIEEHGQESNLTGK